MHPGWPVGPAQIAGKGAPTAGTPGTRPRRRVDRARRTTRGRSHRRRSLASRCTCLPTESVLHR